MPPFAPTAAPTATAALDADPAAPHDYPSEATIRAQGEDGVVLDGTFLRRKREQLGIERSELGFALGYTYWAVYQWEIGRRAIPRAMYRPILEYLCKAREEDNSLRALRASLN